MGYLPQSCWYEKPKKLLKQYVITNVLGSLPELEGKILSMKMPHMLAMGLGGLELELTWEPLPWGLSNRRCYVSC